MIDSSVLFTDNLYPFEQEVNLHDSFSIQPQPEQYNEGMDTQFNYEFDTQSQYPLQIDIDPQTELQLAPLVELELPATEEKLTKWTVSDTRSPTIEVRFLLADLVEFVQFVQLYV